MLQLITFSTLNGVLYGMLLFMMASGLTLIFSMMGVLNFAHASFYMLGAYFGFEISRRVGFWYGLVFAPLIVGAVGALVERYGLRRLHRLGHVSELLFTFGLAFVIEELVQMVWGKLPVDYRVPPALDFVAFRLFDTTYPAYRMFMLLTAVAMFAALLAVLTRTRVELIIQAALTHPDMVAMLGHDVPKIFMLVFGAGAALAGLAGVIAGPALVTQPDMASLLGPILFVVIVVGGLGSLTGAFVASLLIGLVQTFAVAMNFSFAEVLGPVAPPFGDTRVMTARLSALAPWLAFALALVAAPLVFPSATALTMMSVMGIMIIFALSYNMLLGQTGLLSFGHAVYYGLGGFVAIHAMNAVIHNRLGVSVPVIPLVGGLAGLAFGVLFGLVSTRRAGIVFSMISLGIGELVSSSSFILRTFFGGEEGITTNRAKLAPFLGHKFGPQLEVYYLIAVWCFFCVAAMYALTRTPFGRMCNAVRDNPERVEFVGYSPRMLRLIAFCFAAFFAGIAGGLAAISFEIMNAQQLGAQQSSLVLLMTYIGGVGSFAGPIVGAVIITLLQIRLSDVTSAWQLYFGLMFIGVVLFAPEGVVGWMTLHLRALRGGSAWRLAPAYVAVGPALAASGAGAIMMIELANRQLAEARSEGSAMRLFGFDVDASTAAPWIVAAALFVAGTVLVLKLWPRVSDAWGAVNARVQVRSEG